MLYHIEQNCQKNQKKNNDARTNKNCFILIVNLFLIVHV